MVKNPPCKAGDTDSIPDPGTKIPHATGQLRPSTVTRENPGTAVTSPCATMKTQRSQNKKIFKRKLIRKTVKRLKFFSRENTQIANNCKMLKSLAI